MILSNPTVTAILERWQDDIVIDVASEYGEPGYCTTGETPCVVLGSYWCPCDRFGTDDNGRAELHDHAAHHPRLWAQLEAQGVQFEWHDEWMVDYETNKAYRTEPDSYSWQRSVVLTGEGDWLTPDSDLGDWLDWAADDPRRCLLSSVHSTGDLEAAGFERYNGRYESGWYEGQNDDPVAVTDMIRREHDDVTVVFLLDRTGQFDIAFSAWMRANS